MGVISRGVLNAQITRLGGDDDKFKALVKDMPRQQQQEGWNHHRMIKWLRRKNEQVSKGGKGGR